LQTIENFLEKYQPLRTQYIITETLEAVIGSKERRRLEKYDQEKFGLLYKVILEDSNLPDIMRLITQLNEKAKH